MQHCLTTATKKSFIPNVWKKAVCSWYTWWTADCISRSRDSIKGSSWCMRRKVWPFRSCDLSGSIYMQHILEQGNSIAVIIDKSYFTPGLVSLGNRWRYHFKNQYLAGMEELDFVFIYFMEMVNEHYITISLNCKMCFRSMQEFF